MAHRRPRQPGEGIPAVGKACQYGGYDPHDAAMRNDDNWFTAAVGTRQRSHGTEHPLDELANRLAAIGSDIRIDDNPVEHTGGRGIDAIPGHPLQHAEPALTQCAGDLDGRPGAFGQQLSGFACPEQITGYDPWPHPARKQPGDPVRLRAAPSGQRFVE